MGPGPSKALELARLKVIQTSMSAAARPVALVDEEEARRFRDRYVTASELSDDFDMSTKVIAQWLRESGVSVIGSGRPIVYERSAVESIFDIGKCRYQHLSSTFTKSTLAHLMYLKIPEMVTKPDVEKLIVNATPQKKQQLQILYDLISGMSFRTLQARHGKQTIYTFCHAIRLRGVMGHVSRRRTVKCKLSPNQRDQFEQAVMDFIILKEGSARISQSELVEYIRDKFDIDYDVKSISALIRRSGVKWPTDKQVLSRLTNPQRLALKKYSQEIASKIRSGQQGLTLKTVQSWIEDRYGVSVSLASVGKYNRDLGVDWPSLRGRSDVAVGAIPAKAR